MGLYELLESLDQSEGEAIRCPACDLQLGKIVRGVVFSRHRRRPQIGAYVIGCDRHGCAGVWFAPSAAAELVRPRD